MTACQENGTTLPYYNTPDFEPVWNPESGTTLHSVPAFSFLNQNKKTISNADLEGKITLVNFIFTSCGGICPDMTHNLRAVQQKFSSDKKVQFISYSVKPWEDTPDKLEEFAINSGIENGNWNLLTGDKATIYALARQGYFAEEDAGYNKDSTEFLHTENVLLIDGNKHIRGIYKGTLPLDMDHIASDIAILEKERD
jgi:protein SCO1/2